MAQIYVRGEIDDWTSRSFRWSLQELSEDNELEVCISSVGGSVFAAMEIYNAIANSGKNTSAIIEGLCLSSATLVAMACKHVKMYETGFMMLHNPSLLVGKGDAEDLRKSAEFLEKIETQVLAIYAKKTKLSTEDLKAMMDKETWLTSAEAKQMGFVDEIISAPEMAHYEKAVVMTLDKAKLLEMCATHKSNILLMAGEQKPIVVGGGGAGNTWTTSHHEALMLAEKILKSSDEKASVEMIQNIIDDSKAKDAKIDELNQTVVLMYKQQLEGLIQGAIDDGRITAMEATTYRQIGNYEQVNALLKMKKPEMRLTQIIHRINTGVSTERAGWTLMDWSKNDPQGLLDMEDKDPESYKALVEAQRKSLK